MPVDVLERRPLPRVGVTIVGTAIGVVVIGFVDYATGIEVRVFPLYYLPICIAAWWAGGRPALLLATWSTAAWLGSNLLAGQRLPLWVDVINTAMQLGSFVLVGGLLAGLRAAHARERDRSRTDPLTGLLNMRGFLDQAPRIVAQAHRYGEALTMAYVDLDDFKKVNDSQGHAMGDEILRIAARTMTDGLRGGDLAARMGGDEFVLLLPHTDAEGARTVLERLHVSLQQRLRAASPITGASMGAAAFVRPPSDLEQVIRRADRVMYAVKAAGRGRVVVEALDEEEAAVEGVAKDEAAEPT